MNYLLSIVRKQSFQSMIVQQLVVKSSRKEGRVFIDFAILANALLADGENTQEDEEIKRNKANKTCYSM